LALTPQNKLSLWGKYNLNEQFAVGIGFINQSSQFASVDNAVKIKGYNRFDGAFYYKINKNLKSQINVENIFNKKYYSTAHNNNNLQPGSIRAFKANLVYDF
jgi:catecholate siderophore receptor